MASNVSMFVLREAYAAEDAAIAGRNIMQIQKQTDHRIACTMAFVKLKPKDVNAAIEALCFVLFIFSEGSDMPPTESKMIRPLVVGAVAELNTHGLTLAFLLAMRLVVDLLPDDNGLCYDPYISPVLRNVLAWASRPRPASA